MSVEAQKLNEELEAKRSEIKLWQNNTEIAIREMIILEQRLRAQSEKDGKSRITFANHHPMHTELVIGGDKL